MEGSGEMKIINNRTIIFLQQITPKNTNKSTLEERTEKHKSLIEDFISEFNLPINVHYFSYSSELNTLGGNWNIFLDERKPSNAIINDFNLLLNKFYLETEKALP